MKMNLLDGRIVNLGFGLAQRFEDADGGCLRGSTDGGSFDDLANFRQAAAVAVARLCGDGAELALSGAEGARPGRGPSASLRAGSAPLPHGFVVIVMMRVIVYLLFPENFARQILLAARVHIDLGCRNSASLHSRDLQPRADIERRDRVFQ